MDTLDVGEVTTLEATFRDKDRQPTDTLVTLTIIPPTGPSSTPAPTHAGLGYYTYDLLVDAPGLWRYVFAGSGNVTATLTGYALVGASEAGPEGPCEDWACVADVQKCRTDLDDADDTISAMLPLASGILYDLTEHEYPGYCERTRSVCIPCTCGYDRCVCGRREIVTLRTRYPIVGVIDVTIDGASLDPTAYRVDDWADLVRLDGQSWPRNADLRETDSFAVTWVEGHAPPPGGARAAAIYAAELTAACLDLTCRLPQRVTQIVREGVTYTIMDSQKFLEDGKTGIEEIDAWLAAWRRGRQAQPAMIDPDVRPSLYALGT